jgi:hypothetical protein
MSPYIKSNQGGNRMRHDPRAMAVLFGWLDRQRLDEE